MDPLTEAQIRGSFVNCTKGEVKRLRLPSDLGEKRWDDLDFLGWIDPRAPMQSYLVAPVSTGELVGVQLRRNVGGKGPARARMCSLCITTHPKSGVALMVAPRAGQAGRDGNSVGIDICADLACSFYARGILAPPAMSHARETLSIEDRIARLQVNVETFLGRARAQA